MRPFVGNEPNRTDVLARLLSGEEVDIQGLVADTGLSVSTVLRSVDELMNVHGMVEIRPSSQGGPGRPARRVALNRGFSLVAGVDLGGTNCRIVLSDALGGPIAKARLSTPHELGSEELAEWLVARVEALAAQYGAGVKVGAVGIGLPGALTYARDRVVGSLNLPAIIGTAFMDRVIELIDAPVRFDNDSNLALLGELKYGDAPGTETTVLLILGTGISAAAAVHGEILSGAQGSLGEFGRLAMPGGDVLLRDLLSGAGLPDYARKRGYSITTSREIVADPLRYADLLTEIHDALQHVLGIIALAYEPKAILLSGGFSDLFGSEVLKTIGDRMRRNTLVDCDVRASSLRDDSGLLGAMALGLFTLYQEYGVEPARLTALAEASAVSGALALAPVSAPTN
jgi:predicted NBD/HSP70 family sugar kinase